MPFWLRIANGIDRTNEWIGRSVYWLTLFMVLIGAFNAIVRYLDRYTGFGLSSNTYLELQWYLYSIVFLLGAAYTLKRARTGRRPLHAARRARPRVDQPARDAPLSDPVLHLHSLDLLADRQQLLGRTGDVA